MEAVTSMSELHAEVRALSSRVHDQVIYRELSAGQLSLERYRLLLWALRQVHIGVEHQLEAARQPAVKEARKVYRRKVPFLERDLVAACGKELVVPPRVNAPLDDLLGRLSRPTTPARTLGRLVLLEALRAGHALPLSGFAASAELPSDAGGYLGICLDDAGFEEVCTPFKGGLTGEVPQSNALQAAGELADALRLSLSVITNVTDRQTARSA